MLKTASHSPCLVSDEYRREEVRAQGHHAGGEADREALEARPERDEGVDVERHDVVGRPAAPYGVGDTKHCVMDEHIIRPRGCAGRAAYRTLRAGTWKGRRARSGDDTTLRTLASRR